MLLDTKQIEESVDHVKVWLSRWDHLSDKGKQQALEGIEWDCLAILGAVDCCQENES